MLHILPGEDLSSVAEPPNNIVSGTPLTRTLNGYESSDGLTFCGTWMATVGAWRVSYDEWEHCHILSGRMSLTPDGGTPVQFGPGDSFVIEPGFSGIWTVIEDMAKTYVIRLPEPAAHG